MPENTNKSLTGDLLSGMLKNPEVQQSLFAALVGLISGLFSKKKKEPAPTTSVTTPTPNPNSDDEDFPDDIIPAPKATRKISKVVGKISRVQLNRQRFPDAPNGGLYNDAALKSAQAGGNIPYGSKVWIDATAYDENGKEFLRDAVIAHGLAYKTEHHVGGAFIIGKGAEPDGSPTGGYETNDTDEIGNGISAWISSLGFLHQIKMHGEGQNEGYVVVGGVKSAPFPVNVS